VSLTAEPVNKRDENAIVVKALLGIWKPIGYVPARKLPKVTDAMRKSEITSVALNNIIYRYIYAAKGHRYFAKILILKRNRWIQ
jgi:fumarate reductase subunit D